MKKLDSLALVFVVIFSIFATMPIAVLAFESSIHEAVIVVYATPPTDDSETNSYYELLGVHWYTTINYYVNPSNNYGFSTTNVVNTVKASANTWDAETSAAVFSYRGTIARTAGKRDRYNVVAFGRSQRGIIAVTTIWYSGDQIIETDCKMNTYYKWSLNGEPSKMDVQNIMTHEFGHWCGLNDLYQDKDYWLTMYGYSDYGLTYARTLGLGDILGLQAVYGK